MSPVATIIKLREALRFPSILSCENFPHKRRKKEAGKSHAPQFSILFLIRSLIFPIAALFRYRTARSVSPNAFAISAVV